jgi:spermidine/putrescine transport system permease protein
LGLLIFLKPSPKVTSKMSTQLSVKKVKTAGRPKSPKILLLLLLPGLFYLGLFFITPFASLITTSLQAPVPGGGIGRYQPGLEFGNYVFVVTEYFDQIVRSFVYATLATLLALVISYPIAYFIGVKARNKPVLQALLLTLVIAPFFISFLLRTFAWKQVFSQNAFLSTALRDLGLMADNEFLLGSSFVVVFGLTYNFIPFMTLPLYTNLERLDTALLEAGSDLYAKPTSTFWKVTFPLSIPGITSGTLLTFIPIAGDYVTASGNFLGSPNTSMLGNVIEANFITIQDFPSASALSVLLMAAIVVMVSVYIRRTGTEDLL